VTVFLLSCFNYLCDSYRTLSRNLPLTVLIVYSPLALVDELLESRISLHDEYEGLTEVQQTSQVHKQTERDKDDSDFGRVNVI